MRIRTKIVCTIGPAVNTLEKMIALIEAGMNVARLNLSHGSIKEHAKNVALLKQAREKTGQPLSIMVDTKGPEVRLGDVGEIPFQTGQHFTLVAHATSPTDLPVDHPEVLDILFPGHKLLFDDGYIIANVVKSGGRRVEIEMQNSGAFKSRKKVNIPGVELPLPAMTPEDAEDLKWACSDDVDYVAASFIRNAHHVLLIKDFLAKHGKPEILVIAKIETAAGVQNFDSIIQVADGIMVARGDLGVELDLSLVPKLQKQMIRKCYAACKPVVTATQMLESMIQNPRPTRAEVSDVANAIYDSTSSIMLSAETAAGKYPIETVKTMKQIAIETEADFNYRAFFDLHSIRNYHDVSSSVSLAAVKTAYSAGAKAIFAFTTSGVTARHISRLRPEMPIIAVTSSLKHYHQLAFNWGIYPVFCPECKSAKEAFSAASTYALSRGIITFGDLVVVTAGVPFGRQGTTNMMIVEHIGEVLVRGHKGLGNKVSGPVSFLLSPEGGDPDRLARKLVVMSHCDTRYLPLLKKAAGLVLQNLLNDDESEKFATLFARSLDLPLLTRADGALLALREGETVTLDPQKGIIYRGSEETTACPVFAIG
jgi:pyruvate kinase